MISTVCFLKKNCICVVIHICWSHTPMDLLLFPWSLVDKYPGSCVNMEQIWLWGANIMPPCNRDLLYEMFYVSVPYSQKVTKVVIFYNTSIIFGSRVIIIGYVWCLCYLTAVWWVPDHLVLLWLFLLGCILYKIQNCGNELVLSGSNVFVVT